MNNINYWNNFYKKKIEMLPSQFAIFIASEYPNKYNLIDFGCGSARDTIFFSKLYNKVIAIDASSEIINKNKKSLSFRDNVIFLLNDLSNEKILINLLCNELSEITNCIFYARFFIHAVDEIIENKLLNVFDSCNKNNLLALEFRTLKDKDFKKQFGNHYRRFVDPNALISKLEKMNLKVEYFTEGRGFAKYKVDDAYVARVIVS